MSNIFRGACLLTLSVNPSVFCLSHFSIFFQFIQYFINIFKLIFHKLIIAISSHKVISCNKLSQVATKSPQSCHRVIAKLSQSRHKVVTKLSQSCYKIATKLSQTVKSHHKLSKHDTIGQKNSPSLYNIYHYCSN